MHLFTPEKRVDQQFYGQRFALLDLCALPLTDEDPSPLFQATKVSQPANAVVHLADARTLPVIWQGDSQLLFDGTDSFPTLEVSRVKYVHDGTSA